MYEYVGILFSYFILKYIVSYLTGSTLTQQNNVKGVKRNSKTEDKKQEKLERTENPFILFHIFFLFLLDIQRETNCNVLEVFVMSSSITSHLLLTSFSQKKDEHLPCFTVVIFSLKNTLFPIHTRYYTFNPLRK